MIFRRNGKSHSLLDVVGMGRFQPAFTHLPLPSVERGRATFRAIHPIQIKTL